jgi:YggT family protein
MVFQQLTEPLLRPIRRILPDLGGIDLSVLVAFLLLNVINIGIGSVLPIWRIL